MRDAVIAGLALSFAMVPGVAIPSARAQTFQVLYTFNYTDGAFPESLTIDKSGTLYGTTYYSDATGDNGMIYSLTKDGNFTVLYNFTGGADGAAPGDLIRDARGNLYGTTAVGGFFNNSFCENYGGCGVLFKLDTANNETVLYTFCTVNNCADGANPNAGLTRDADGDFYGTTRDGGDARYFSSGLGVAFVLDTNGKEKVLHSFTGPPDGATPYSGLQLNESGDLYGTTYLGGAEDGGSVFKIDKSGAETVVYSFCRRSGACKDGAYPTENLTADKNGSIYGTTSAGGRYSTCNGYMGCGVVFKLDSTDTETVLHSFSGGKDGADPYSPMIRDAAGNTYGVAFAGGNPNCNGGFGCGVVFKLDKTGKQSVLYSFSGGKDGWGPASLVSDGNGNLYGTTFYGGSMDGSCQSYAGCGVVFKLTLDDAQSPY